MYTSHFSDFDEIVHMLLQQPTPLPPDDLRGIVQHYVTTPEPSARHVDLLLVALARPEFDDAQLDDVWAARPDARLRVRGARLAGLAARAGADVHALLRAERSLTARLLAARLTFSPDLLSALAVNASADLLAVLLDNPQHPEEVDLAAIDFLERPHGYHRHNLAGLLRRTPAVEARVRASGHYSLRYLAWDWCDTPEERLAFATEELAAAVAAGDTDRMVDVMLGCNEAPQLPTTLLRELEALVDAGLTARVDDDSFSATYWQMQEQKTLHQVRRLLHAQADDPHPPVAVLFDRILYADYGEATEAAKRRALREATALLGNGAAFWVALAQSFDSDASIPDLISLARLLSSRPQSKKRPAKRAPSRHRRAVAR